MGFQSLYNKHKASIEERWLPIKIDVTLAEEPEKKISILKEAQQQAVKEIHDIEVKSTFITFLEMEIDRWKHTLSQNGSANAQGPVQRNETLNTGESKSHTTGESVEKINWRGTETQLVLLVDLLTREALLKSDRKWKMIEEHFLVQGKPTKSKNLSQSLENTLAGKTKDKETLKKIVSEVKKSED